MPLTEPLVLLISEYFEFGELERAYSPGIFGRIDSARDAASAVESKASALCCIRLAPKVPFPTGGSCIKLLYRTVVYFTGSLQYSLYYSPIL